ncbi:type I restriction-modification system subunit M N-terminal domain-containing protein [Microbacterium sp. ZW T5_45]|uniref:type I restriction-modification system subunit M N-terminal domain-containing protein n=1 Tax=Microbacterium sp. ZW T5_45 TaxID=3378080 RepID=UPI003853DD68
MVNHVTFIWNIAESLRGPFKPAEYGSVVLPFTVLRRLDAVLAETKSKVLNVAKATESMPDMLRHLRLTEAAGHQFYNTSPFDFAKLVAGPQDLRANMSAYLAGFSENVRDIFERFEFDKTLNKLAEKNKLYSVTRSSRRQTSIRTSSATSTWASSSRSSFGGRTSGRTRPPATITPRAR